MPRFRVIEERAFKSGVLIEAADEEAAQRGDGTVLDSAETDSWGERLIEVEQVDDDEEELGDL